MMARAYAAAREQIVELGGNALSVAVVLWYTLLQQQKPQINHQDGVNPQYRRRGGAKFTAPQTF